MVWGTRTGRGDGAEGTGDRRGTGSGVSGAASLIFMRSIRKFPNDFALGALPPLTP